MQMYFPVEIDNYLSPYAILCSNAYPAPLALGYLNFIGVLTVNYHHGDVCPVCAFFYCASCSDHAVGLAGTR
jgi:hypothetical protein